MVLVHSKGLYVQNQDVFMETKHPVKEGKRCIFLK